MRKSILAFVPVVTGLAYAQNFYPLDNARHIYLQDSGALSKAYGLRGADNGRAMTVVGQPRAQGYSNTVAVGDSSLMWANLPGDSSRRYNANQLRLAIRPDRVNLSAIPVDVKNWRRFSALVTTLTTDSIPEGATNLYFTNARALAATAGVYVPYAGATGDVDLGSHNLSTNSIYNGSNSANAFTLYPYNGSPNYLVVQNLTPGQGIVKVVNSNGTSFGSTSAVTDNNFFYRDFLGSSTLTNTTTARAAGYTSAAFYSKVGAANTQNWTGQVLALDAYSSIASGATGTFSRVAGGNMGVSLAASGASVNQAVGASIFLSGAGLPNVSNLTVLYLNNGSSPIPVNGKWTIFNEHPYPNYLGSGATLIAGLADNGTDKLQVYGGILAAGTAHYNVARNLNALDFLYKQKADSTYELTSNKSATTALGTSNTLYPTQGAVKAYVDSTNALKLSAADTGTLYKKTGGSISGNASFLAGAKYSGPRTLGALDLLYKQKADSLYLPITAGAGYIQNQSSTIQTANFKINGSGTVNQFFINKAAETGLRETLWKATISDAPNDMFFLNNQTAADGSFMPGFSGITNTSSGRIPLSFNAYTTSANDAGTVPLMTFQSILTTSATDPANGTMSSVSNRPLFDFRNNVTSTLTGYPNGNWNFYNNATVLGRVVAGSNTLRSGTHMLEVNASSTLTSTTVFDDVARFYINGIVRQRFYMNGGGSMQLYDPNNGGEVGVLSFGTPGGKPGISFTDGTGNSRTDFRLLAGGGLSFSGGPTNAAAQPWVYLTGTGLGVGANPVVQLHSEGASQSTSAQARVWLIDDSAPGLYTGHGIQQFLKTMPTATGQRLGFFTFGSLNNNVAASAMAYNAAAISAWAAGPWSTTSAPSYLTFETAPSSSINRLERLRITQDGYVGIGTTAPATKLTVSDGTGNTAASLYSAANDLALLTGTDIAPGLSFVVAGNASAYNRGVFKGTRSRGTLASPTVVQPGDQTFSLLGAAYDGTAAQPTAAIDFAVESAVSPNVVPQYIGFSTAATGSRIERMRVTSKGNLLINTTTDNSTDKLQIKGGVLISGGAAHYGAGRTLGALDLVYKQKADSSYAPLNAAGYVPYSGATTTVDLNNQIISAGNASFNGSLVAGGPAANLDPDGGNINYMKNTGKLLIGWNHSGSEGETDFIANPGVGTVGGFSFYNYSNTGSENLAMRIKFNGYVGIGVSNPDSKLTVNGTIHAREVKIDTNLPPPDYVFAADYNLASLEQLRSYLKQNHHLPEIPSAKEMEKNGINLGEMNTLLLKKVEELTLYLLQKDDQLKEQTKINDQQKKDSVSQQDQINELKKQIELLAKAVNSK